MDDVDKIPAERVGDLFNVVINALREQRPGRFNADPSYEERAWEQFVGILEDQTGLDRAQFTKPAYFVRDLAWFFGTGNLSSGIGIILPSKQSLLTPPLLPL